MGLQLSFPSKYRVGVTYPEAYVKVGVLAIDFNEQNARCVLNVWPSKADRDAGMPYEDVIAFDAPKDPLPARDEDGDTLTQNEAGDWVNDKGEVKPLWRPAWPGFAAVMAGLGDVADNFMGAIYTMVKARGELAGATDVL